MPCRSWTVGDPQPRDHPPLVDNEDITWLWDPEDHYYCRQIVTHHSHPDGVSPGAVIGSPILDWDEILDEYGPVREATNEEITNLVVVFAGPVERECDERTS